MTKRRTPGSFEAAIATVVSFIGAEAAGDAIGKSAGLIYKASDPESGYMLNLDQAVMLDQACIDAGFQGAAPVLATYRAHLDDADHAPAGNFRDVRDELLDAHTAMAIASDRIRDAIADHVLTANEIHEIEQHAATVKAEIDEAVAAARQQYGARAAIVGLAG